MGKSQEIECAVPIRPLPSGFRLPELNQPRLLWMNSQAEATKSLRKYIHDPVSIYFQFTANNKVIGKANQKASTLHPGFDLSYKPVIQHLMQEYVTQHRGNYAALGSSLLRIRKDSSFHYSCVQPFPDQP